MPSTLPLRERRSQIASCDSCNAGWNQRSRLERAGATHCLAAVINHVVTIRVNCTRFDLASCSQLSPEPNKFLEVFFQERVYFIIVDLHQDAHSLLNLLQEDYLLWAFICRHQPLSISIFARPPLHKAMVRNRQSWMRSWRPDGLV